MDNFLTVTVRMNDGDIDFDCVFTDIIFHERKVEIFYDKQRLNTIWFNHRKYDYRQISIDEDTGMKIYRLVFE